MKKPELLVPAGNMECLYQAVQNGCDAVYLACKNFGARKFAANFTNEEIVEAIRYCHLYGVRVFVTMNTLVKNDEVDDFLKQALFLYKTGVDALIVQDFGMICLLREKYPNLEIHASTQANVCSREVCKLYYKLGVKRVVFARELNIDEIKNIDVPIEKEVFIHGALCISYSGCCLMSSMLGGRSGNRGECAGVCRMPFSLIKKDKVIKKKQYLLSTKELNTIPCFDDLLNSNIDSFKIEGRMKGPIYVGFITRLYRRLIDGDELDLSAELDSLRTIFNREFTVGRLFRASDEELMNTISPNHIGLRIGRVVKVLKNKACIQLDVGRSLHQHDAIRFQKSGEGFVVNYLYDEAMKLTNLANNICYVEHTDYLEKGDIVYKTQDFCLQKEFQDINKRKVEVSFSVKAFVGKKLEIEISDGVHSIIEYGDIVEESIKAPLTKESICKHLGKLGDSSFVGTFNINCDSNIFIPIQKINDIRRKLVLKLMDIRMNDKKEVVEKEVSFEYITYESNNYSSAFVRTEEQYLACRRLLKGRIYTDNLLLWNNYENKDSYLYFSPLRCSYKINNYSRMLESDYRTDFSNSIGNYTLNATNIYTAYYLRKLGLLSLCLSVELSNEDINQFINLFRDKFGSMDFEVLSYGRVENMIIKGNILGLDSNSYDYYLVDSRSRKFPVYYDGILTHVLNHEIVSNTCNCGKRYDFYDEKEKDIIKIVNNN